jgi:diketogulonate reductase-like aldo/keto reductase
MSLNINTKIKLNNGIEVPLFGLGTWELSEGETVINAVQWAISNGYRHIDTARIYGNEKGVGKGLKLSLEEQGLEREEIFITTKLWIDSFKYEKAIKAFNRSLNNLGLDYVDLYLLHWPEPAFQQEAWKALESILKENRTRSIGVSNFYQYHLDELLSGADIIPAVNQVEFTPYLYLKELKEYCDNKGIMLEAYSPLTRGRKLKDPKLQEIAKKYNKSSAQILLRWGLQHNVIEIPKSSTEEHIVENSNIFDFTISKEDIDILDKFNEGLYIGMWNPTLPRWK